MNRVFVYGSLKRGQPHHNLLSDLDRETSHCQFIGSGKTKSKWPLVIASEYNFPYLLDAEGEGHHVKGEVYEVDDDILKTLDLLEDYPKVYDRRMVLIQMEKMAGDDQSEESALECMLYLLPGASPELMKLERLENFDAHAPDAKPFHVLAFDREKGFTDDVLPSPDEQMNN